MRKYIYSEKQMELWESECVPLVVFQAKEGKSDLLLVSDGMCEMIGLERENSVENLTDSYCEILHPADVDKVKSTIAEFLASDEAVYDVICRAKNLKKDKYVIVHAHGHHIYKDDGTRMSIIWCSDAADFFKNVDKIENLELMDEFSRKLYSSMPIIKSYFDPLTGLPNMFYFLELAETGRKDIITENQTPVVLACDLSGMKKFNSEYGLEEGNKLLCIFADILKKYFGAKNCGRYGEDHFAVYTGNVRLEERLQKLFEEFKYINGGKTLTIRVGIYKDILARTSVSVCYDLAKLACNAEKNTYNSRFIYYDERLRASIEKKDYIINHFEEALKNQWIRVYYQPIIRTLNEKICNEEALARWFDPNHGVLSPEEFIPVLESVKLIYKLDIYMVEQIIEDLDIKMRLGINVVPVSVNLSRYDFENCDMVAEITRRLDAAEIPRKYLVIEITETVAGMEPEFLNEQIRRFHESGFKVWMDDFGSGYSSLNILQKFNFDLIKLDMSFLRTFDSDGKTGIILRRIVQMARELGIEVLAEGVEDERQIKFLKKYSCDKMQGYYYMKPNSLSEVVEYHRMSMPVQFEDPKQIDYYKKISKINLIDPYTTVGWDAMVGRYYSRAGSAIIEYLDDKLYLLRSTNSYDRFLSAIYKVDLSDSTPQYLWPVLEHADKKLRHVIDRCIKSGKWENINDDFQDVSDVYYKASIRDIAMNPVTGAHAIEILQLSYQKAEMINGFAKVSENEAGEIQPDFYKNLPLPCVIVKIIQRKDDAGNVDFRYVFVNQKYCDMYKKECEDFVGKTYIELFPDSGDEWIKCAYQALVTRKTVNARAYGKKAQGWIEFATMPTSKVGYCAVIFTNVEKTYFDESIKEQRKDTENAIIRIVEAVNKITDHDNAMNTVLQELGEIIHPSRLYILETDRKTFTNTFEWCAPGVPSRKALRKNLDYRYIMGWEDYLRHDSSVVIEDINVFKNSAHTIYKFLKSNDIDHCMEVPLYDEGHLIGYLGADNYDLETKIDVRKLLESASRFIASRILVNGLLDRMRRRSNFDELTNVHNRNAMLEKVDELKRESVSVGIVFADLNGLKTVNDTEGHFAGDRFLKRTASFLSKYYGNDNVYRTGGDEFAIFLPNMQEKEFIMLQMIVSDRLKENIAPHIAIGFEWCDDSANLEEAMRKVDKKMYQDKAEYYKKYMSGRIQR
ncbi:MAG: EAL domain-containing protein [Lachnospiraceae bacterium]|nr:EAL domain-containing protein [Lachnospiraceae bacterium]